MRYLVISALTLFASQSWSDGVDAVKPCKNSAGAILVSLQGKVFADANNNGRWQAAKLNDVICEGSRVRVEQNSRASLSLSNSAITLRLAEGTVLTFNGLSNQETTLLSLLKGFIHFISRTPKRLEISSPIANAGPEGTEFAMRVDDASASLWVYEGGVKFFNGQGSVHLKPGQEAQALLGQAPRVQVNIKPEDAVNWALYYPPVLTYPDATTVIDNDIRKAILDYRQGHVDVALTKLDALPAAQQTPYFYKVRAAMRLTAGQDKLAQQDIQALLTKTPKDAEAFALQSIRALTQNHKAEAYALASEAVAANPQSASAYSALSYVEQGQFHLDKAQVAADQAAKLAPHDAMVWARKAELELSQGLSAESQQDAQKALALDASLERTQTVMGFSDLTRMDTDAAVQRFKKAVQLDSTSPLPRLGLGLAKIRQGHLQEGRQDLEIAAVLDPNDSIIRSYLGKAYYEEKRNELAEDQFSLAKARDPKDPTPYFYDAIKKQTENRPVEALENMQEAVELNNNRAVYRSKQTLDSDLAARSAAQGRIYNDLGFSQRALFEGWKSVNNSPNDYSSHRFLADAYQNQPGLGSIARTSELLQSQLMQPLNMTPVQPSLGEQNLLILRGTGPSQSSFNEFNPLFNKDGYALQASGMLGNFNTRGDEATISGVLNKFSYSLGQFHYQTDGYRPNNDLKQNIYNAFFQVNITPSLSLQAEFRHKDLTQGDLSQQAIPFGANYLPDGSLGPLLNYDSQYRQDVNQDRYRLGATYRINETSQFIASGILSNVSQLHDTLGTNTNDRDYLVEGLYQRKWDKVNLLLGGSNYEATRHPTSADPIDTGIGKFLRTNGYIYTNTRFPSSAVWTIGMNVEGYESPFLPSNIMISPKIGLTFNFWKSATFRLAVLRGSNHTLNEYESIEPTQVAGFNQIFYDRQGTDFWRYGTGIDQKISSNLFWGVEASFRELATKPFYNFTSNNFLEKWREQSYRAYLNWALLDEFALSLNYRMEKFTTNLDSLNPLRTSFPDTRTHTANISARYFHKSGFFLQIDPTFVYQNVEGISGQDGTIINQSESFFLLDSTLGFRLPKRLGIIKLQVKNIFDEQFNYQNEAWRSGDRALAPQFYPARTIVGSIFFAF